VCGGSWGGGNWGTELGITVVGKIATHPIRKVVRKGITRKRKTKEECFRRRKVTEEETVSMLWKVPISLKKKLQNVKLRDQDCDLHRVKEKILSKGRSIREIAEKMER